MNEGNNILILRYLNNELTASEIIAFEEALRKDISMQQALEEYTLIIKGVKQYERNKTKANIAAIGATIGATKFVKYAPTPLTSGGGFGKVFKFLFKIFFTLLPIAVLFSLVLIYLNKFPIQHPAVKTIQEQLIKIEQSSVVKIDTVYHTIESNQVLIDTVLYGEEELEQFLEGEKYE